VTSRQPGFVLVSPKNRTVYNFRGELVRAIAACGFEVVVTGPTFDDVDRIEGLGARFVHLPMDKSGFNVVADLKYLVGLWRLYRAERPKVILGYTAKPVIYGALAAKAAGVSTIAVMVTGAGYAFAAGSLEARLVRTLVKILYRIAFACADVVIFQNPDDRDEFVAAGLVRRSKTRLVNGSGVNLERFTPKPLPERLTFFMLARILRSKGVAEYLAAARLVKQRHPEVRFVLLGALESQPDSLTWADLEPFLEDGTVEYFGETADVAPYFAASSVFVLPSYREGTPRTVLEAMAMGRPVITSDAPGCRETVIDGLNGFLVPLRDIDALVERMEWFVQHPEQVATMGVQSRVLCAERFDVVDVNVDMLEHLGIGGARSFSEYGESRVGIA